MTVRAPSVAVLFAVCAAFGAGACSGDDDADEEQPVVDVGESAVGTCLAFPGDTGAEVTDLPTVECTEPHSHEIFAVPVSSEPAYPGFEALEAEAQTACLGEFEAYVGTNPFDSELFYSWLVPTLTSWDQEGDREIICVAGNGDGAPLVGSVEGSNR